MTAGEVIKVERTVISARILLGNVALRSHRHDALTRNGSTEEIVKIRNGCRCWRARIFPKITRFYGKFARPVCPQSAIGNQARNRLGVECPCFTAGLNPALASQEGDEGLRTACRRGKSTALLTW